MSRLAKIILTTVGAVLVIFIIVFLVGWIWGRNEGGDKEDLTPEEIKQQQIDTISASPYERLLFVRRPSGDQDNTGTELYVTDFLITDTAQVDDNFSIYFSNFLPNSETWFSIQAGVLKKHTFSGSEDVSRVTHGVADTGLNSQHVSLAVSSDMQYVAWASPEASKDIIVLYNLKTNSEVVIFDSIELTRFTNLTWSPDSSELAFTDQANRIITISPEGAQLQNPFSIPFTEFDHLNWIEQDNLAAVITSTENHPEPFDPTVAVLNRSGQIIEQHDVLERSGIPRVLWSPDANYFIFYDQWKSYFKVHDRFGNFVQIVAADQNGKLMPLGWTNGAASANTPFSITPTNTSTININKPPDVNLKPFSISADQWDQYNEVVRSIVGQFKIDEASYRFGTTDTGIEVEVSFLAEQSEPEAAFLQILLQSLAVLPEVTAMSLTVNYSETDRLTATNVSPADIKVALSGFTTQAYNKIFVVNNDNPLGKKRPKTDYPDHTYFGDLIYTRAGAYNPNPILAALDVQYNEMTFFSNEDYSLLYAAPWSIKQLSETVGPPYQTGDVLFYTGETAFASESSWNGFSVTVRNYSIPEGATLDAWLLVNRNDRTIEDTARYIQAPFHAKRVLTGNEYSDEYVFSNGTKVYVITIDHPPTLSEEERAIFNAMITSFSDNTSFHR